MSAQTAQQLIITYNKYYNTTVSGYFPTSLFINGNSSIFIEHPEKNQYTVESGKTPNAPVYTEYRYIKIDHTSKKAYFFDSYGSNRFLIEDIYPLHNWTVTSESKNISGYKCLKATTNYRGRVWDAWFTPDIPLPYGPWKLCGLPGLIIEATEDTGKYTFRVENIEYKRAEIFDREFASLVKTRNREPIPIKDFIRNNDEFHLNARAEMKKQWPDGVYSPINLRHGYELKYEWEE